MSLLRDLSVDLLPDSWSQLHLASYKNDTNALISLLQESPDKVDALDANSRSPLQIALENGHAESVLLLLENGASFEHISLNGLKRGEIFESNHYFKLGLQVLHSSYIEVSDAFLSRAICHAVTENNVDLLHVILSKNSCIINACDVIGLAPIHYATIYDSIECVSVLLANSAKSERISKTNLATPLHLACRHGNMEIADLLVQASGDVAKALLRQDSCGRTPVHLALYHKHWDLVSGLLSTYKGLFQSTKIVDQHGHSISGLLFYMRCQMHFIPRLYQFSIPCLTIEEATWLLHSGISDQDRELVEFALQQEADPDAFDFTQQTPLILASKLGVSSICSILLKRSIRPAQCDWGGRTALHFAAQNGHQDVVTLLLDHPSFQVDMVSGDGSTPLELAMEKGHTNVLQVFLDVARCNRPHSYGGDWMKLLMLSAFVHNVSYIKDILTLFCPSNWAQIISDPSLALSNSSFSPFTLSKDSLQLKVYCHSKPSPTVFLKMMQHPSKALKFLQDHTKTLNEEKESEFSSFSIFKPCPVKDRIKKRFKGHFFRPKLSPGCYYPVHAMLRARNTTGLVFLIKQVKRAGSLGNLLALKDSTGVSVATLLAGMMDERELTLDSIIEKELMTALIKEYTLPEGMSFGWALLHLLAVKHSTKCVTSDTPLSKWPSWFISKRIAQTQLEFINTTGDIDITDFDEALKLASVIMKTESIKVFETIFPYPSLVFTATVNGVSIEFLQQLLTDGELVYSPTQKNRYSSFLQSFNCVRGSERFEVTEALIRGYYQHADEILRHVDLKIFLGSKPSSLLNLPSTPSDYSSDEEPNSYHSDKDILTGSVSFEKKTSFFLELMRALHHLVANGDFDVAKDIIEQIPKEYLGDFLVSCHGLRCLTLCICAENGSDLGQYLLDKYLKCFAVAIGSVCIKKENNARTPLKECSVDAIMYKLLLEQSMLEKFAVIIGLLSKCSWYCHSFDLISDLVNICLHIRVGGLILHELCGHGCTTLVQLVVSEQGREVITFKDNQGRTPIYYAAAGGHIEVVEYLLECGVSLDPSEYGCHHPFLGVLSYFKYTTLHYCKRAFRMPMHKGLKSDVSPQTCSYSMVFEDLAQSKKLVNLVLPPLDIFDQLASPEEYFEHLLYIYDLRPFEDFINEPYLSGIFSRLPYLASKPNKSDHKVKYVKNTYTDRLLINAFAYNAHISPELCQTLLSTSASYIPTYFPLKAARLGYWNVIKVGLPLKEPYVLPNEIDTCQWMDIFSLAIRQDEKDIARHILHELKKKENNVDKSVYFKLVNEASKSPHSLDMLEEIVRLPLEDEEVLKGLLTAARYGNREGLQLLSNFRPTVWRENITAVLSRAASSDKQDIVDYLYDRMFDHVVHPWFGRGNTLAFWVVVLESAVKHGLSQLSLYAMGNLSYSDSNSLSSWNGFPKLVDSCCWWGMTDVLESLSIENSEIYFTDLGWGVTPFESAVSNGQFSKLSELSSFPRLMSSISFEELSLKLYPSHMRKDRLELTFQVLSTGWWKETMHIAETTDQTELSVNNHVYLFAKGNSIHTFVTALKINCQVVVQAFLNQWGGQAGALVHVFNKIFGVDVVECTVQSRNRVLVEVVLRALFESNLADNIVTLSVLKEALVQNNLEVLLYLRRFVNVKSICEEVHSLLGTILHILAIYCKSHEAIDLVLSMIVDYLPVLLETRDKFDMLPLQCAIYNSNYLLASKLMVYIKEHLDIPLQNDALKRELEVARGWFHALMIHNERVRTKEGSDLTKLDSTSVSLRDSNSLKKFYNAIKNTYPDVARVILEASCGVYPVGVAVCEHENESSEPEYESVLIPTMPLMTFQDIGNWMVSDSVVKWIKNGQQDQVVRIFQYIHSSRLHLAGVGCSHLFNVACSCSALKVIEFILISLSTGTESTVTSGFVNALVLGQLEAAAYIVLNSGLALNLFEEAAIDLPLSKLNHLLFFGKPEEIVFALCSPPDVGSRIAFAQIWLMHPWGHYQNQLFENKLNKCRQLMENWRFKLYSDNNGSTTHLHIDYRSFNCINERDSGCCPLYHLVTIIAACVTHLYPLSHSPPSHSFNELLQNSPVEQLTIRCVLEPIPPQAKSDGYYGDIILSYNPQTGIFKWPEPQTLPPQDSPHVAECTPLRSIDPALFVLNSADYHIKLAKLGYPVKIYLDAITDCVATQGTKWSASLSLVLLQCINDVLSTLQLASVPASLYCEFNILPNDFKKYYRYLANLFVVPAELVMEVCITFDVSMSEGVVTILNDNILDVNIHLEIAEDTEMELQFLPPTHQAVTRSIATELLGLEYNVLQYQIKTYIEHCTDVFPFLQPSSFSINFEDGAIQSLDNITTDISYMYLAKLHPLLERFLTYFFNALSSFETALPSSSLRTSDFNVTLSHTLPSSTSKEVKIGIEHLPKHQMHLALKKLLNKFVSKSPALSAAVKDIVVPSTSSIVLEDNRILFYSEPNLSTSAQVKLCDIRGNLVRHVTLNVGTSTEQISAKFPLHVRNSPLKNIRAEHKQLQYKKHNEENVPIITLTIDDDITCIVSHPNGGCTGRPKVFLPHYTSVRQAIAPFKQRNKLDLSTAIAQDHPVHYISVVREGSSEKLHIMTASYIGDNPVQIVLIAKKPIKKRSRGPEMTSCQSLGQGVYRVSFRSKISMNCNILSTCSYCQCVLSIHWPEWSSIWPQPCIFYPGSLNPRFSFVGFKLSSKTNESIPPIKAGCNLKVFLFARDRFNNPAVIHHSSLPRILLKFNGSMVSGSYLPCHVVFVKEGVLQIESNPLQVKGQYDIVVKMDSHYPVITSFKVKSSRPSPQHSVIDSHSGDGGTFITVSPIIQQSLLVFLKDQFGNPCNAREYIQHMSAILIDNVSGSRSSCDIVQHQQEDKIAILFTVYGYNPTVIKILIFGDEISGSPVLLKVDNTERSFKERYLILKRILNRKYGSRFAPTLPIDRNNILESAINVLSPEYFKMLIRVRFGNEPGIDDGGVSREFFHLLSQELINPQYALFQFIPSSGLYKPNSNSAINPNHLFYFEFFGKILAKAICEGRVLQMRFTPAVYKFLLSQPATMEDLKAEDIDLYNGLQHVLKCTTEEDLKEMTAHFTTEFERFGSVVSVELIQGGSDKEVTLENREKYVQSLAQYRMIGCIQKQLEALFKGFSFLIGHAMLETLIFSDKELELVLGGEHIVSIAILRSKTMYEGGYNKHSEIITWFWNTLEKFSPEELSALLKFTTGAPNLSMHSHWYIKISKSSKDSSHLPSATTCSSILHLPQYSSQEELEEKLKLALSLGTGFYQS